ncbi:MAG: NAD-binding protein, partial [Candidatus Dormibacteraeota bacterium]|nr:NAD-binding protein [Candidatus Dormibacteraeota bacterium]
VGLALGTALIAQAIGLSLAFGAFLAGLVIAESEYRTQVVAEVLPLRDIFIALFFVSVGMLIDPRLLIDRVFLVGVLTGVVVVGKMLIGSVAVLLAGMPARVALLAGLSLAQVGEFSFVLARVGVDRGAIPSLFLELILATSLTTVILAPFTIRSAPILIGGLRRLPLVGRRLLEPGANEAESGGLKRHAVICGYGRVGRELVDALGRRRIPCLVIEYNPDTVRQLRARGVPVIYGDASNPGVLHHAGLAEARILAVLTGDPIDTEQIVRQARVANPRLDIVARARDAEQVRRLQRLGVTEVVQPEFEAGVEVIRHALQRYGVSGTELNVVATGRRRAFYERGLGEGS